MTRDGEIAAIFNPRRARAPSVVVTTGDSPNGPFGSFTNILNSGGGNPQITHSDSLTSSQHDGVDSVVCIQQSGINITSTPTTETAPPLLGQQQTRKENRCKESCCSELAQKMYFGVCVTILVTASWVGATHCIKFLYIRRGNYLQTHLSSLSSVASMSSSVSSTLSSSLSSTSSSTSFSSSPPIFTISTDTTNSNNTTIFPIHLTNSMTATAFNAPFFASWFCTNFAVLFFPIYLLGRIAVKKCESPGEILGDVLRGFRDRGFTIAGRPFRLWKTKKRISLKIWCWTLLKD